VLIVTSLENPDRARQQYEAAVFSPMLGAFQRVFHHHIWSRDRLEQARKEGHPVWNLAQKVGILFYGEPLAL
jgi:hypothetical protein